MFANLYAYFGLTGLASMLLCVSSLAALGLFCRSAMRGKVYLAALGLALVAWLLAGIASNRISEMQISREAAVEDQAPEAATPDTPAPPDDHVPSYRQRGKQKRDPSQQDENAPPLPDVPGTSGEDGSADAATGAAYSEAEVLQANRWDRWNLLAVRVALLLAFCALLFDYVVTFNRAFRGGPPLPLAGPWLDRVSPKAFAVGIDLEDAAAIRVFLERAVRKGETFVYLGPEDPLPGDTLPRLKVWGCRSSPSLNKVAISEPAKRLDPAFVFESLWFGRHGFAATDEEWGKLFVRRLPALLRERIQTHARARATVNVLWDFDTPLSKSFVQRLIELGRQTNFRIVVTASAEEWPDWKGTLEEFSPQLVPAA
ncbi:MAG: hypothetical protein HS116_05430 [Planctomycetes bacterium]|nr:hypothetical protein [Planctomycetota bacterium]